MDVREITQRICGEVAGALGTIDEHVAARLIDAIVRARRVFVSGAGRSGQVARCLATRLTQLGLEVHVVGDATVPKTDRGDLVLLCSGSGRTPTTLAHARQARRAGATVALITARPDSPAASQADLVACLSASTSDSASAQGNVPHSIQPMGSLFEQALLLYVDALVIVLAERLEQSHRQMWERHTNLE